MTRTQEEMKDGDEREMRGQVFEKFCRYTTWQMMENAVNMMGSESETHSMRCRHIIA